MFDYKSWARWITNYPEVYITYEMREKARTTLPMFIWYYYIEGNDLELYDIADLTKVLKAD